MSECKGALEDLLVLDLTRVVSGPFCGSVLGDMGARVIKVETPITGDDSRMGPPFVNGESAYFALLNRSKQGVTLNLKAPEGKKVFLELVKKADVLIENYRPGVMKKLGLDYSELKKVNDQLIYGAITGFGCYGPYMARPGYDIVAQAMGGLMSLTGPRGGAPTRAGNAMGDMLAGMNMVIGILSALHYREQSGKGQMIDVSLVDSIVVSLENAFTRYWAAGELYKRNGNAYAATAPYDTYRASDGDVVIACANPKLFELFCTEVIRKPEWLSDERFAENEARLRNMDELKARIEEWSSQRTVQEIVTILMDAGIPTGPVYDIAQIVRDEHIAKAREMFPIMHHPVIGDMPVNGTAIKMMDTMPHITMPSPTLGQHNNEVYAEFLGMSEEEIADYTARNIF